MKHRTALSFRALLLLLLALGPLQVQTVFACAMMDTVVHDGCCCDEHDADGIIPESSDEPCCERSVGVTVDQDTRQDMPIGKSAETRPDLDPPPLLVSSFVPITALQQAVTRGGPHLSTSVRYPGSHTWLITQRLRI